MRHVRTSWWGKRQPPLRLIGSQEIGEPSEADLVRGLVAGEEWAATMAWNRYAPLVYGMLDRALGSATESEDLTQEVFWRVFAGIRKLENPNALRSYIYSAALRMLRWHLRSKRIRRLLTLSDSGDLPDYPAPGADTEGRDLLRRFYRLLDSLGANARTAYVLRHIEGFSIEEIARATGVSLATVKRRIRDASQQIAKLASHDPELASHFARPGASDEP